MQRMMDAILVVLLLLLAGYLYHEARPHPTIATAAKLPLAMAEPVRGLERGNGPNLAARVADFVGGGWRLEGVTMVRGVAVAPDGSKAAYRLVETSANGLHRIETSAAGVTPGAVHTLSLYVKPAERDVIQFEMRDGGPGKYGLVHFNLQDRAVTFENGDVSDAGIEALPDGWNRCWAAMPYSSDTAVFNFALIGKYLALSHVGSASKGLLIWGVQFEPGSQPRGYAGAEGRTPP